MNSKLPMSDDEINAYADGQLRRERAAQVALAMEADAGVAAHVNDIRRQNARLRDALDPWLSETLPRELIDAATAPRRTHRSGAWMWPALAAACSLVIGLGIGWFTRGEMLQMAGTPVTFSRQAALTHALYATDQNRPVEIWANEEERLVRWLSKRLSFQLRAPDLNSVGYELVGGRLVAGNEKPGALFIYQNADKQRISLLIREDREPSAETAFRYALEDGVGVFYWIDNDRGYALSGSVDKSQLLAVARVVYGQLAVVDAAAPKP